MSPDTSPHKSLQDELSAAQRLLEELARSISRLEQQLGSGLEVRRMRSDAEHLRESFSLLKAAAPEGSGAPAPEMVSIPDRPYDQSLWTDTDDEGLGAKDRHAP